MPMHFADDDDIRTARSLDNLAPGDGIAGFPIENRQRVGGRLFKSTLLGENSCGLARA